MHVLLACDPGKTGAVAIFEDGKLRTVFDADGDLAEPFARELLDYLDFRYRVNVVIEKVNGVPGQSGPASFNFGAGYGELLGICRGLAVVPHLVTPATWKWKMGLRGTAKSASLDLARKRWPRMDLFKRAKDEGRAEAALLGAYWLKEQRIAA
jgi:crossover junction endodeoxyribonuclease RuvC